jgi:hypothetical protein
MFFPQPPPIPFLLLPHVLNGLGIFSKPLPVAYVNRKGFGLAFLCKKRPGSQHSTRRQLRMLVRA